ncbi:MAG: hypothetical protein EOO28_01940 [Comamonadaceae bacterium]|nr:MAG: hypothetical protein EOO28_01940 [Comamonadaceae bacterium]
MLFQRLIWCSFAVALLLGSIQSVFQQFQTVPIILAAEVFEGEKVEPAQAVAAPAPAQAAAHDHAAGAAHSHEAEAWTPADGFERNAWTWVANVLHAFSMALLVFAVIGAWVYRRGAATSTFKLAFAVAAAGWLSIHFWPSLGLHAEIPGMDAARLGSRQGWWVLAAVSAAAACAVVGFGTRTWRFALAAALLALPFVVGAPHLVGDPLAGFSGPARATLEELGRQFIWATTWLSISFWGLMGLFSALAYARWLKPVLPVQAANASPAVSTAA